MKINNIDSQHTSDVLNCIIGKPGNNHCANCDTSDPTWACPTLGILVCYQCSPKYRTSSINCKSLVLDKWSEDELKRMATGGNKRYAANEHDNYQEILDEKSKNFKIEKIFEINESFSKFGNVQITKKSKPKFSDKVTKREVPVQKKVEEKHHHQPEEVEIVKEEEFERSVKGVMIEDRERSPFLFLDEEN